MEQAAVQEKVQDSNILERIQSVSVNMVGWLKFLGVIMIILGALTALSIVGIIIAWVPIWLGVLLLQAGSRANSSKFNKNFSELVIMMDKLRLFFLILGILLIVEIVLGIIGFLTFGAFFSQMMQGFQGFNSY